jgi:hypothetical protein
MAGCQVNLDTGPFRCRCSTAVLADGGSVLIKTLVAAGNRPHQPAVVTL